MSIDLVVGERHTPSRTWNRASVEAAVHGIGLRTAIDVLIVFGGWGMSDGGAQMPEKAGESTGTTQLIAKLRTVRSASGNTVVLRAWHGQLRADVTEAEDFVRTQFHPLGKLVVCGYSAGGFNAMALARNLHANGYYNVNKHSFQPYYHPSTNTEGDVYGIARIDLLVTIDAALGPMAGSRTVAPSVRKNLNIYQLNPSGIGAGSGYPVAPRSHGGPSTAVDESATKVDNRDWTARYAATPTEGHGKIDNDAIDVVVGAVREELGH